MGRNSGGVIGSKAKAETISELAKDAIDYYVSGNGYDLNYSLRGGLPIVGEDALLQKGLDEATAKPLLKNYILYRGVSAKAIFGEDAPLGLINAAIHGDKSADAQRAYSKVKENIFKPKRDSGYMSSSLREDVAEGFGGSKNVVMRLSVRRGVGGIDSTQNRNVYRNNTNEKEVILKRGLRYQITKVYPKNGKIYVDAKII